MTPLRNRFGCFMAALLCLAGTGCRSAQSADTDGLTPIPIIRVQDLERSEAHSVNEAVIKELQLVVDFDQNTELDQVIQYARKMSGQNIAVNWPALEIVGIDRDSLITINAKNITLEQLLRIALDQVSADAFDDDKAGFVADEGMIKVSTLREVKEQTYHAVYNVGWYTLPPGLTYQWLYRDNPRAAELLKYIQDRRDQLERVQLPPFDLNDALSSTNSGGSNTSNRGKDAYEIREDSPSERLQRRIDRLIEIIETTVGDPDEWLDEVSTIQPLNDQFIIKTTHANHEQLTSILTILYHNHVAELRHESQQLEVFLLLDEAEQLRLEQDYKAALVKINLALRVDPYNPKALALRTVINQTLSR